MSCEYLESNAPQTLAPDSTYPTVVRDCTRSDLNNIRCAVCVVYQRGQKTAVIGECPLGNVLDTTEIEYPKPMHEGAGRR